MKREEAINKYKAHPQSVALNTLLDEVINGIYDQHEVELNELKNRTCKGCRYFEEKYNYLSWCTLFSMSPTEDFCCNEWESK